MRNKIFVTKLPSWRSMLKKKRKKIAVNERESENRKKERETETHHSCCDAPAPIQMKCTVKVPTEVGEQKDRKKEWKEYRKSRLSFSQNRTIFFKVPQTPVVFQNSYKHVNFDRPFCLDSKIKKRGIVTVGWGSSEPKRSLLDKKKITNFYRKG